MPRCERPLRVSLNHERSVAAFDRAARVIPGGVNSPVRAFRSVGGTPVFVKSAAGCMLVDLDGNAYIDYVMSWGPLILGHAHPLVIAAVRDAAQLGTSYGAPTEAESELAELVIAMVPSIEKVRFCSSGTEATMSALRLARGFTGRAKVVKFAGCYHGHGDAFLISAGSGALTNGVPDSPGITEGVARDTIVVDYNDVAGLTAAFAQHGDEIAAVIVEPYVGNMGLVLPLPDFLPALRALCTQHGAVLIFDEVMTGFRVAPGGVQEREGITPDLTTLGKIIGGGLPVGAFGGRAEIMDRLSPAGPVYQAGTLSGNPLAMAAGLATLRGLQATGVYTHLESLGARFAEGMAEVFRRHSVPHVTAHRGSMVGFFFTDGPVTNLGEAQRSDVTLYGKFFHAMLERGVYLAPSQFEAGFLSTAHRPTDVDHTLEVADAALTAVFAGSRGSN
jgi:glutamate-1-semialdehyde 2,1-aminomutase